MNDIRQLIGKGRLQEALETLIAAVPAHLQNDATLLQTRLNQLERSERLGVLGYSEAGIERAKITHAILELCTDISNVEEITQNQSADPTRTYRLANIHRLLNAALNDDDLQTLCLLHFETVYNNFAVGQTKAQRILALLDHVKRTAQMDKLLQTLQADHPVQYAQHEPYL
jgi:hypothetical protein